MPESATTVPTAFRLEPRPFIAGALHLPPLGARRRQSIAQLEDYVLANARAFVDGGIEVLIIQDQTRAPGPASAETIAVTSSLVRLVRAAHPRLVLGVIVQAHDAEAPLAIAHASGADFVRLKILVGQSMTAEGPRSGLGVAASHYRDALGRPDIGILADVHDRTSVPSHGVPFERAAAWTVSLGADCLVITGDSFADTLARIAALRRSGVSVPIVIGGGIDQQTIGEALRHADGAIVSRSLMLQQPTEQDGVRWDSHRIRRLLEQASR